MQIGQVGILIDQKFKPSRSSSLRPLTSPHLPSRIIAMEVRTTERLPTAMWTAFNVAAVAVTLANWARRNPGMVEFRAHVWSFI